MKQFETIFRKITALVPDLQSLEPGQALKLKSEGFMDLSIDILNKEPDKIVIAMAHNYIQNGDVIPDPDMEIAIYPKLKMAEALTYQDTFGYKQVYPEPGYVYPKMKKELNQFLNQWLNNIKMQGHTILSDDPKQGQGRTMA